MKERVTSVTETHPILRVVAGLLDGAREDVGGVKALGLLGVLLVTPFASPLRTAPYQQRPLGVSLIAFQGACSKTSQADSLALIQRPLPVRTMHKV